ncbi:MAG: class I SAM-dependent rRNA methyltransferase [Candidatus Brocadiia bacterium]
MSTVHLKRARAKPFFFGHPWVFSGSVDSVEGQPEDGELVDVVDDRGQFIARGYYNGRSQIRVRLVTWMRDEEVDADFFERRLRAALSLRHDVLRLPERTGAYRLVHSEGDGLPGLIVDRYARWVVVQALSVGVARRRETLVEALGRVCPQLSVFERSDTDMCEKEGIEPRVGSLAGDEPPELLEVDVHGVRLLADLWTGHKTGLYLDQRENYLAILPYARERRVLDGFCHGGAFGLFAAAQGGALEVTAVDQSEDALVLARRNAELNGVEGVELVQGNVFGEQRRFRAEERRFGMIVLDPPSFARSSADVAKALRGYKDINLVAMQCLEPGGILVTCSCSQHVDEATYEAMLNAAARDVGRDVQVLERRSQGADHPVAVSCPESRYLKCFICRVL